MSYVRIEKLQPDTSVIVLDRPERMMWAGLETASLGAVTVLESHTQPMVRLTTRNFEEADRAHEQGRQPDFKD